ncbi:alkaline phosphatase D family protein [Nocardioides stalactiti]|uniref:alkaline phosphatase D family protein n=1 Tax=Nocardioides stalactiti TaxID=2755356 RepID=UPI001C80632A|nr:alkaline phosphatase D family protein [Nocardioides stalactiti]
MALALGLWDDQSKLGELRVGRRTTMVGSLAVGGVFLGRGPALVPKRKDLTTGVRSGEVTTDSAVLWSRAADPGRMMVRLESGARRALVKGPWTDGRTDLTARIHLTDLAPGREYDATVWFEDQDGTRTVPEPLSFRTAPIHAAAQSVVWSGDMNGQGWGIDRRRGGMTTFRSILDVRPDLFINVGDTIYADEPMEETTRLLDGSLWRNELTHEVTVIAQTLAEFRGRHRYPLRDDNLRDFYATVPSVVQWDDHETANNWWPGEFITEDGYDRERRADVLATRARRAWQEYQPVPVKRLVPRDGDGFVPTRIYRKVPRGQHLDLFLLDMRSHRGPNSDNDPAVVRRRLPAGLLGREQEEWLVRELRRSTATWKIISIDQPLSAPPSQVWDLDGVSNGDDGRPLGREQEIGRILSAVKRHGITGVHFVTADVHYTAAHHYAPERAAFTDFEPFWEFVSGPLSCSPFTFRADEIDRTFGPETAFSHSKDFTYPGMAPPEPTYQHFGELAIAATGELTVVLRDGTGAVLWQTTLEPPG